MIYQRETIVLVGALRNYWYLIPLFTGRGYTCINIYTPELKYLMRHEDFSLCRENICYDGDFAALVSKLSKYKLRAIVPGIETTLDLAEQLAETFALPHNNAATTHYRNNKYWMNEALRLHNVPYVKQSLPSSSCNELQNWFTDSGLTKAIFKPIHGALSVGIFTCTNTDDIRQAFDRFYGAKAVVGTMSEFIVQEFIEGTHFWVNTVSVDGQHFTVHVVQDTDDIMDDYQNKFATLLSRHDQLFQEAADYTCQVLDAVGIRYGAAHTEVRKTPDGWRLIEVNPRITGGLIAGTMESMLGVSQTSLLVDSILEPDLFKQRTQLYQYYPEKEAIFVYMVNNQEFTVQQAPDYTIFNNLDTFSAISFGAGIGEIVPRSVDVYTIPGYAMLLGEKGTNWHKEFDKFRKLEKQFYQSLK